VTASVAVVTRPRGRPRFDDLLTPAEWRVVEAVRHGMTNPEIARRQGVSIDAIKYHVANALQKLGFTHRAELRVWDGIRGNSALSRKALSMK
jgi:DNA-binding NarL/FixJ family response regulator